MPRRPTSGLSVITAWLQACHIRNWCNSYTNSRTGKAFTSEESPLLGPAFVDNSWAVLCASWTSHSSFSARCSSIFSLIIWTTSVGSSYCATHTLPSQHRAIAQPAATCTLALFWTLARILQPPRYTHTLLYAVLTLDNTGERISWAQKGRTVMSTAPRSSAVW